MVKYETTNNLEVGDYVYHLNNIYKVKHKDPRKHCSFQCCLYNEDQNRCDGFCFRWKNCDNIVFEKCQSDEEHWHDIVVKETPYQKVCREYDNEQMRKLLKEKEEIII